MLYMKISSHCNLQHSCTYTQNTTYTINYCSTFIKFASNAYIEAIMYTSSLYLTSLDK